MEVPLHGWPGTGMDGRRAFMQRTKGSATIGVGGREECSRDTELPRSPPAVSGVLKIQTQETSLIYRRMIKTPSPLIRGDLQGAPARPGPYRTEPHSALSLNPSTAPPASLCEAIYDVLSISVLARERGGDGWSLGSYPSVTWPQSLKRF